MCSEEDPLSPRPSSTLSWIKEPKWSRNNSINLNSWFRVQWNPVIDRERDKLIWKWRIVCPTPTACLAGWLSVTDIWQTLTHTHTFGQWCHPVEYSISLIDWLAIDSKWTLSELPEIYYDGLNKGKFEFHYGKGGLIHQSFRSLTMIRGRMMTIKSITFIGNPYRLMSIN